MAILSKGCKPDNFEPNNSLKRRFRKLRPSFQFGWCESFRESNSPNILALCETNVDDSISLWRVIHKDSIAHMYGLAVHIYNRRTWFCTRLISRKLCWLLLMFLTGFTSLSILLLFPLSITFVVMQFFILFVQKFIYNLLFWKHYFLHSGWSRKKAVVTFFMILKELIHFYENCIKFAVCRKHEVTRTRYDFIHRIWFNLWYSFTMKLILWNGMLKYGILFKYICNLL